MRILLFMQESYIKPIDYTRFNESFADTGGNVGNRVFCMSLYKILDTPYNEISFCVFDEKNQILNYSIKEINEKFDAIVIPCILIGIKKEELQVIKNYYEALCNTKIPIHIFSIGSNVTSYECFEDMQRISSNDTYRLMKLSCQSGGTLAVRGEFTKRYLEAIGIKDSVLTGCQSLYQNGRNLVIRKKKVNLGDFKIAINGHYNFLRRHSVRNLFKNYDATYFDQDCFKDLLYGGVDCSSSISQLRRAIIRYTDIGMQLYYKDRIKLIGDIREWNDYLINEGFTLSFGERIHGNIVALLSGIPSIVCWSDARTREMSEFFKIPNIYTGLIDDIKKNELYKLYDELSFDDFNSNYVKLYDNFENHMVKTGLVKSLSDGNESINADRYQNFQDYENIKKISEKERNRMLNKLSTIGYPIERCDIRLGQLKRLANRIIRTVKR